MGNHGIPCKEKVAVPLLILFLAILIGLSVSIYAVYATFIGAYVSLGVIMTGLCWMTIKRKRNISIAKQQDVRVKMKRFARILIPLWILIALNIGYIIYYYIAKYRHTQLYGDTYIGMPIYYVFVFFDVPYLLAWGIVWAINSRARRK